MSQSCVPALVSGQAERRVRCTGQVCGKNDLVRAVLTKLNWGNDMIAKMHAVASAAPDLFPSGGGGVTLAPAIRQADWFHGSASSWAIPELISLSVSSRAAQASRSAT